MKKTTFLVIACMLVIATNAQTWSTSGNAISSGNFLGTTNNLDFILKRNSTHAGLIGISNTGFGVSSFPISASGIDNSAFGTSTLTSITTGNRNSAFGSSALQENFTGNDNTAIGASCLTFNRTGSRNTAVGVYAFINGEAGDDNVAIGYSSMAENYGNSNSALGTYSLSNNFLGYSNVAIGTKSLFSNNYGHNLVAIGDSALYHQTTNSYGVYGNTAIGSKALYSNTTGAFNTGNGSEALLMSTVSDGNSAFGYQAMKNCTTGYLNTGVGTASNFDITTGYHNIAIGTSAGSYITTGNANVCIGDNSFGSSAAFNTIAIGTVAGTAADNQARIGNSGMTSIGGYQPWTNVSDGRIKNNITHNVPGLLFINKLSPVTYTLNLEAIDKITQPPQVKYISNNPSLVEKEKASRNQMEKTVHTGFIAQDVEKAAKSLGYDFSGVDASKNEKDLYGLRYAIFVVPLVKAVQELSVENDKKDKTIADLNTKIDQMQNQINEILLQLKKITGSSLVKTTTTETKSL